MRASAFQESLAYHLGVDIDRSSFNIAAAQLTDAVAPALWPDPERSTVSGKQIAYAEALGIDVSRDTKRVASVKIQERLDARNRRLIADLKLAPGCIVYWKKFEPEMIISSIAENGRLWFKGGNGQGAFPHEIELVEQGGA